MGGPVRDALLGRPWLDLDLTTDARPEVTEALLRGWGEAHWSIGKAFGTIGARRGDLVVEVTTYRSDVYDGATRKPEVTFGDCLDGDLARRDFTVNAMAVSLPGLTFVDPHGGLTDLVARRLRTPAAPEVSFGDDPLRMMRAARFAAQLGFDGRTPTSWSRWVRWPTDWTSWRRNAAGWSWRRLLLAAQPQLGLRLLVDTGLADRILPELAALRLEIDEHHRHKDVYEHSLTVLEQAIALEDGTVTSRTVARFRDLIWCSGWRRCCTTSASQPPGGSSRAVGSASTTTRWSGRSWSRGG